MVLITNVRKVIVLFSVSVALTVCVLAGRFCGACRQAVCPETSRIRYSLLRADSTIVADSVVEALIRPYRDSVRALLGEPLCVCDEDLVASRPESNMTRFLADLFLYEVRALAEKSGGAPPDFALLNVGGIRSAFHKGQICISDVFQVAPFENSAVVLRLDSSQVRDVVAHIAERGGEALAGVSFSIGADGDARGVLINGKPLDGALSYRLATLDYIATGGDDFECLVGRPVVLESGVTLRDLIITHLERLGKEGRHAKASNEVRIFVAGKANEQ